MATVVDNRTMAAAAAQATKANVVINVDDDDDDSIDEDQLQEYREELESLGSFPDKVTINSLSMVAEDHADSKKNARKIYQIIRHRLLTTTSSHNLLPVIYVLDSVLKNVKGHYIALVQEDAVNWMPEIYDKLNDDVQQRSKLQKVWRTWNEFKLFDEASWKAMGRCFSADTAGNRKIGLVTTTATRGMPAVAGISRTKDGSLILPPALRKEMQNILDDMQSDVQNELEKVSLERLADINPDLLQNIKNAAEESSAVTSSSTNASASSQRIAGSSSNNQQQQLPPFLTETRPENTLRIAKQWSELQWDIKEQTHDVIAELQHRVMVTATSMTSSDTTTTTTYTQQDALRMTEYLATASATAHLLTAALERIQNQADQLNHVPVSFPQQQQQYARSSNYAAAGFAIDGAEFTSDGIKKKNAAVVGLLYEIGLPFVSSVTGRRFRTQIALSEHLDALFKRNQLAKTMACTAERGWYVTESVWTGESSTQLEDEATGNQDTATAMMDTDDNEPTTVPADESRDRCVICGINFKMFFDEATDGCYKYSNCREIVVLNDDAAATESDDMLVHVTCWKGLGSPETLTADQALQDTLLRYA